MEPREAVGVPICAGTVGAFMSQWGGSVDAAAAERTVDRLVAPPDSSRDRDLVVLTSTRFARDAVGLPGVLLCDAALSSRLPVGNRWVHEQVWWAVTQLCARRGEEAGAVSAEARIDPAASVAPSATVRAGAVIRGGAVIGPECSIGENAVIYGNVRLGARVMVGPGSVVGRPGFGWARGPDGDLVRIPQRAGVIVEDDVEIGPLCTVDAGTLRPTRLSARVKLDAHVHIGHNTQLGEGVLVAAQAGFAGSVKLGAGVMVGGQAGVADHVEIGAGARIAAKSGVIGDIPAASVVAGFPALPRMQWLRAMAAFVRGGSRRR